MESVKKIISLLFIIGFSVGIAHGLGKGESMHRLRLATTTSTDNSGLLDVLIPAFEAETGIQVEVIAVGTGKAMTLGERGDVDVLMVHARRKEDEFIREGYGVARQGFMHNDFVILGPETDPAGIRGAKSAAGAFRKIVESGSGFISRGDESGTNIKEKEIWRQADIKPVGNWYKEAGQGMGAVIVMADDLNAYTLSDRGTYLSLKDKVDILILFEGDPILYNPYGVIAVNPARYPNVNYSGAMAFIDFVTSREGQDIIRNFRKAGQQLFYPDVYK